MVTSSGLFQFPQRDLLVVDDENLDKLCRDYPECRKAVDYDSAAEFLQSPDPPELVVLDMLIPRPSRGEHANFQAAIDLVNTVISPMTNRPGVILVTQADDFTQKDQLLLRGWLDSGLIEGIVPKTSKWDTCRLVLGLQIDRVMRHRELLRLHRDALKHVSQELEIVGDHPSLQQVLNLILNLGKSELRILISGESGTGKELVAKALHKVGMRKNRPFITYDCGTIPIGMASTVLFGHEKGSFTGAERLHVGLFEQAHGGTLFLDEIGNLPLASQIMLLRILEEHKIRRFGSEIEIPVDVRLICATSSDLNAMVAQGSFRQDLYYRICEDVITVPPLRERISDLEPLAHSFLERTLQGGQSTQKIAGFTPDAIQAMRNHQWPGNIRELYKCVKRAVVRAGQAKFIDVANLGLVDGAGSTPINTSVPLPIIKRDSIPIPNAQTDSPTIVDDNPQACFDRLAQVIAKPMRIPDDWIRRWRELTEDDLVDGLARLSAHPCLNLLIKAIQEYRTSNNPNSRHLLSVLAVLVAAGPRLITQPHIASFLWIQNPRAYRKMSSAHLTSVRRAFPLLFHQIQNKGSDGVTDVSFNNGTLALESIEMPPLGDYSLSMGQSRLTIQYAKCGAINAYRLDFSGYP